MYYSRDVLTTLMPVNRTPEQHKTQVLAYKIAGFTLVELLVAVAVAAVGMVFVLGALSQCLFSLATTQKLITANGLLNDKIWEVDSADKLNNGSEVGEWSDTFPAPHQDFAWVRTVTAVSADFGNVTSFVQEGLNEEILKVTWNQGRTAKDVSVARFVKRKKSKE